MGADLLLLPMSLYLESHFALRAHSRRQAFECDCTSGAGSPLADSSVACNDDFETCMWRSSVEEAFRGSSRPAIIDHETIVVPAHSERTIVRVSRVF